MQTYEGDQLTSKSERKQANIKFIWWKNDKYIQNPQGSTRSPILPSYPIQCFMAKTSIAWRYITMIWSLRQRQQDKTPTAAVAKWQRSRGNPKKDATKESESGRRRRARRGPRYFITAQRTKNTQQRDITSEKRRVPPRARNEANPSMGSDRFEESIGGHLPSKCHPTSLQVEQGVLWRAVPA